MPLTKIVFVILTLLLPGAVFCAEINHIEINHQHEQYYLTIKATVNAEAEDIKRIITDYDHLTSINPYLSRSEVLRNSDNGRTTVDMLSKICIFIFCYNIKHVQIFHPVIDDIIYARIIPRLSDFKSGWLRWQIKTRDSSASHPVTEIIFDTELIPGFFVAPVIGPYQIKRKMLEIATKTIDKLEETARRESTH